MHNLIEYEQTAGKVSVRVLDPQDPADHVPGAGLLAGTVGLLPSHVVPGLVHPGAAPGQVVRGAALQGAAHVGDVLVPEGEDAGSLVGGGALLTTDPGQDRNQ